MDLHHFVEIGEHEAIRILMKACLVYQNVRNATWIVKRHLAIRIGVKWV